MIELITNIICQNDQVILHFMNINKSTIMVGLIIIILVSACGCTTHTWRDIDRTISDDKIISLDLESVIKGSFFLGCGHIGGKDYYYYYKIESDGAYTLQKAPAEFSRIYMDTPPENAHVIIVNKDPYPTSCRDDVTDEVCKKETWVFKKEYAFHVPPGTIVQSYDAGV